jgi:predicted restriction endonuclease
LWRHSPNRAWAASFSRFLDYTQLRHTPNRTPLNELLVCRRGRYVHNTQQTRKTTSTHILIKIRIHNPSSEATANPRLRPHGHWDLPFSSILFGTVLK